MTEDISKQPGEIHNEAPTIRTTDGCSVKPPMNGEKNKKKKGEGFGLLKAALFKLRQHPGEKPKPAAQTEVSAKGKWKKLVGAMRPLHLQDNPSPPPSVPAMSTSASVESLVDMVTPDSPSTSTVSGATMSQNASANNLQELVVTPESPSTSTASGGTMSQYASANNLQELEKHVDSDDQEEDPDEVFDAISGDEMIDAKADEFIAQFYQEMMLQQSKRTHRHHHHKGKAKV